MNTSHDQWKKLDTTDWKRQCFAGAYLMTEYLQDQGKSPMLVHGTIEQTPGKPIAHAWVEWDGHVWDVTDKKSLRDPFPQASYYQQVNPRDAVKMTFAEARLRYLALKHYGPWDETKKPSV